MENRIRRIMTAVFGIDASEINQKTSADTLEEWDSLRQMSLILALEEEFGINFDENEVSEMISFPLILLTVREKLRKT